jgi:prepilin-type processing-associated H-X9-DG protein
MTLSDAQKQLLFDCSFGLTSPRDNAEVEELLSSSEEAKELCDLLKATLSPLDALEAEPCPDELAERTIQRLKEQAQLMAGTGRLEQLLAAEHAETLPLRVPFWRNWAEVAVAAAILVLFVSILFPAFGYVRQKQWQSQCQSNLASIYGGTVSYMADHNGQLPIVASAPGSPWWKVGVQGPENHSNTRRAWLLVRNGYVPLGVFICAARRQNHPAGAATLDVTKYDDFPSRSFIQFSIRIDCSQSTAPIPGRRRVLLADLNPLAEALPQNSSAPLNIELCDALLKSNSMNHRARGQNVLFCDGSVEFDRTRHTTTSDDDIYTSQAMSCGCKLTGNERPTSESDNFVAP